MSPLGIARGISFASSGASYKGTDVSADLLFHAQGLDGSNGDVTTSNGYESNGINVNGTTYNAKFLKYSSATTFGSGNFDASGDTIMIVEAMKTMNHVPSNFDGIVKEICVSDGQPVEFGQTLIIIE